MHVIIITWIHMEFSSYFNIWWKESRSILWIGGNRLWWLWSYWSHTCHGTPAWPKW